MPIGFFWPLAGPIRMNSRCTWLLTAMLAWPATATAQDKAAGPPQYCSPSTARPARDAAAASAKAHQKAMRRALREAAKAEAEIKRWKKRVRDLQAEKERELDELRRGRFCSRCMRTATAIEKTGEPFLVHLKNVKGTTKSAPPERILALEKSYDERILSARKRVKNEELRQEKAELLAQKERELMGEALKQEAYAQGILNILLANPKPPEPSLIVNAPLPLWSTRGCYRFEASTQKNMRAIYEIHDWDYELNQGFRAAGVIDPKPCHSCPPHRAYVTRVTNEVHAHREYLSGMKGEADPNLITRELREKKGCSTAAQNIDMGTKSVEDQMQFILRRILEEPGGPLSSGIKNAAAPLNWRSSLCPSIERYRVCRGGT